ncbi:hypothetical protein [Pedobacter sp. SYSU D00535]|uniref:hypothetical protein n=1 Tax=Pedobacter sp. SYSU D00535 TaxID=2810308 RepID=UPI001A96F567|nr:hypothetical protein [Pedobacter sp. SYSU D00535]
MATESEETIDIRLQLSSLRALWGEITPVLRSVSVEVQGNELRWQCIFDEKATEDDFELMKMAAAEVIGDFPQLLLKEIIKTTSITNNMTHLKNLIYLRHEANYYK